MRKFITALALAALASTSLASAQTVPSGTSSVAAAATASPQPVSARALPGYTLGIGDQVRITVYNEPALTGEFKVTDVGDISFPLIGNVKAEGKGLADLQQMIGDRLAKGYVRDPKVSIEMVQYRPFYILGEVNKPGEYAFRVGLFVDQAVAAAGGYTYRGNTKKVFLRRADEDQEQAVKLRGGKPVRVMPGDTIRVGERYF